MRLHSRKFKDVKDTIFPINFSPCIGRLALRTSPSHVAHPYAGTPRYFFRRLNLQQSCFLPHPDEFRDIDTALSPSLKTNDLFKQFRSNCSSLSFARRMLLPFFKLHHANKRSPATLPSSRLILVPLKLSVKTRDDGIFYAKRADVCVRGT